MLKLAFCGNDCNLCPRYTATQSGNLKQLKVVAEIWRIAGWREASVSPEEMVCYGCSLVDRCRHGIRECALEKGVDNCGTCRDYPCEKVLTAFEKSELHAKGLREKLTKDDYEILRKAFFSKKANLERAGR